MSACNPLFIFLCTLLDTASNSAHIKWAIFMKFGRCETRCEMSKANRCQGCALPFIPSSHMKIAHLNSAWIVTCFQMLCDLSNLPVFIKTSSPAEASWSVRCYNEAQLKLIHKTSLYLRLQEQFHRGHLNDKLHYNRRSNTWTNPVL